MSRQPLPKDTELRGRYRVDTVLGAGGFGITYLGQDLHLSRAVAIKEYFPADHALREGHYSVRSLDSGNRQFFALGRTWFLREARTLAKYHHPNIVGVIDHFEENNTAYMILRFEDGQSLSRWLKALGRAPTQFEIDGFMLPILAALETMHQNNDMHRDVAMDNIILRSNGDPVLIDFGSARQAIGAHSRSIDAVVKFGYSPPEQYSVDARLQGPWSDVYALASTLHLAVTGKLPPDAPGRQLDDNYQPLAQSDLQGYRIGLLDGIDWGLALRPSERPQSISEWRRTLMKSSHDPLDEDPVEIVNGRAAQPSGSLRTPASGAYPSGPTSAVGTVFVDETPGASSPRSGARGSAGRGSTTGRARQSAPPSSARSGHPGPRQAARRPEPPPATDEDGVDRNRAALDAGGARSASLQSTYLEALLLALVAGLAIVFLNFPPETTLVFDPTTGKNQFRGVVKPIHAILIAALGLCLNGLPLRHVLRGDLLAARSRAMLALGVVWLVTVIPPLVFFGLAFAMRKESHAWHATVLNIAGAVHILAGVLLVVFALKDSPMFVLATSLSLIGLGFLTLLTSRAPLDSNS